jgi:peptidoglycan/LPS O-acetylase OafA/YrhL
MGNKDKKLVRFHQIDGLRAVAVLLVVFLHSFRYIIAFYLNKKGFIFASKYLGYLAASGVDLFFVISGVVLLRPYLRHERIFNSFSYLKRRIERLWPPYLVALFLTGLVVLIAKLFSNSYSENHFPQSSFLYFIAQAFIIRIGDVPLLNAAWWSLSVEVLFYFLIPLIILLIVWRKQNVNLMPFVLIVFLIIAELFFQYRESCKELFSFFPSILLLLIYGPSFFAGILLAMRDYKMSTGIYLLSIGFSYTIIATIFKLNHHNGFALFYFGLVIISLCSDNIVGKLLKKYPMVWIGERSYSIFLIHITVFMFVNYIFSFIVFSRYLYYYIVTKIIGLLGVFLVSMVLFYFIERRFARGLITGDTFWYKLNNKMPAQ